MSRQRFLSSRYLTRTTSGLMVIRPKSGATVVVVFPAVPGQVIHGGPGLGQPLFCPQGLGLADRSDHCRLARPGAARYEQLHRLGVFKALGRHRG
jgi:hypothetical protein